MTPPLTISSSVIDRLQNVGYETTGRLYGVMCNNTLTVLTFAINPPKDEDCSLEPAALQPNMPAEIDLCGVLFIGNCQEQIPDAFKDIDVTDNPLLIKYSSKDGTVEAYYYVHEMLQPADKVEIICEEDIWKRFFYIRVQTCFPIATTRDDIIQALQETRKNIASGTVAFQFPQSNVYLLGNENDSKDLSIKELTLTSGEQFAINHKISMMKNVPEIADAIKARMLIGMSKEKVMETNLKCAPVLHHIKRPFESLQFDLHIDALSIVGQNVTAAQLYAILVESVCRNIRLIERSAVQQTKAGVLRLPIPFHFKPRACGHLITITYPAGTTDDDMSEYRRNLHKVLALDLSRPCFRRGNAVKFLSDFKSNEPLINPHGAITSAPEGRITTVEGLYSYHHYMQDNFDDNGWGCAYRSLQTIVSWYKYLIRKILNSGITQQLHEQLRLQGYTEKAIPTHREIQKCLVEMDDKPSSFVGSKLWIGSTEVGYVLEWMLGITVRVLCVSKGGDMSELASDLAHHFATQGTPVMIGGGVLAHTIIGISYDDTTGDVKYLILDPHYTGPENLTTILNKGWCGWKGNDFWKKDAFYNMCLPQRPAQRLP